MTDRAADRAADSGADQGANRARRVALASRIARVCGVLALAIWLGGLVTLGAVVAPSVFRNVPLPTAAHAMTIVFRRFDRIAIGCAAVALISESVQFYFRSPRAPVRAACLGAAAILAVAQAAVFSPTIDALRTAGAVRPGLQRTGETRSSAPDIAAATDAGARLDTFHRWAERSAKLQVFALAVALALTAFGARVNSETRAVV